MLYISTRGAAPTLGFDEVTLAGLAEDGGLYVPQSWPTLTPQRMRALRIERHGSAVDAAGDVRVLVTAEGLRDGDAVIVTQIPGAVDGLKVRVVGSDA